MNKGKTKCPDVCPSHYIHHSVAYQNKARGFYSNHHLAGSRWENNTSWKNRSNYNMVNRKNTYEAIDVAGYGHILLNNVSWTFTDAKNGGHLVNYDADKGRLSNNSFAPEETSIEVTESLFESTDPSLLFTKRQPDGRLPQIDFLRGKKGGILEERKMGWVTH